MPQEVTKREVEQTESERDVFIIIGLTGAGKSTAAEMVAEEHDEYVVCFDLSDYSWTQFERATNRTQMSSGEWVTKMKFEKGNDYFARNLAETVKAPHAPHIVISGVRSPEEAVAIKGVFSDSRVSTIALWTLPDLRFKRTYGEPVSAEHEMWDVFHERNERELWELGAVEFFSNDSIHEADYILSNHDGLHQLCSRIQEMLMGRGNWDHNPFPADDFEKVAKYL